MFKYTGFVVWVASLSSVCADEGAKSANDFEALRKDCLKKFGNTEDDYIDYSITGDVSKMNPCFYGCYFKKIGLLTDKGQYDPTIYLTTLKEIVTNDDAFYNKLKEVTEICQTVKDKAVSDGEAGCEMGVLIADCFPKEERRLLAKHEGSSA